MEIIIFNFEKKFKIRKFSLFLSISNAAFSFFDQVMDPTFLSQIVLDYLRLGRFSLMLFFFHCILLQEVLVAPLSSNLVTRSSPIVNKNQFNFWYNVLPSLTAIPALSLKSTYPRDLAFVDGLLII